MVLNHSYKDFPEMDTANRMIISGITVDLTAYHEAGRLREARERGEPSVPMGGPRGRNFAADAQQSRTQQIPQSPELDLRPEAQPFQAPQIHQPSRPTRPQFTATYLSPPHGAFSTYQFPTACMPQPLGRTFTADAQQFPSSYMSRTFGGTSMADA